VRLHRLSPVRQTAKANLKKSSLAKQTFRKLLYNTGTILSTTITCTCVSCDSCACDTTNCNAEAAATRRYCQTRLPLRVRARVPDCRARKMRTKHSQTSAVSFSC
jgi:hypothetical protein